MTVEQGDERRWGRWLEIMFDALFFACLALPTAFAINEAPSTGSASTTLALASAMAVWHWALSMRRPITDGERPRWLWFAGILAGTWVLVSRNEEYFLLIWGLYPQVFGNLGRMAIPGVVVTTVAVFVPLGALDPDNAGVGFLSIIVSTVVAVMVGLTITVISRQSEERKEALDALEATRAELAATAWRAGVLEERARLAREVHDTVAQGFTGIIMQLEACDQAMAEDPAGAREHLARARSSARDSLGEVRRAVHALRPEPLEGSNLASALDRTARRWTEETTLPAEVSLRGDVLPLDPGTEAAVLRVVQESLANVARHAKASRAGICVGYGDGRIDVEVTDDGTGFDTQTRAGVGLSGMRERIVALGGTLTVDSRPGRGTRVHAEVPTA